MKQHYTQHVFLLFFWFAMANSAINPIVYFIMNAKYIIEYCKRTILHLPKSENNMFNY